ncbi:hypothetical protein FPV67DRAFT_830280 [Lyophyllum atratum]|nr:hypothetical protein FPV67DRAFT_830280 [Lyophyllum atratum]
MSNGSTETEEIPDSSPIRACPDCPLKVDILLRSSDGARFAAHSQNLEQYSEGFAPSAFLSENVPTVPVQEKSKVVLLLLQYMHLKPQPDLTSLKFDVLEALANAVEKYLVYSAMPICKLHMTNHVTNHPVAVLRYAVKHGYNSLADEAALLAISQEFKAMKSKFEKGSQIPYIWLEYREQWMLILRWLYTDEPPVVLHKGGLRDCESWAPFYWEVLRDVGSALTQLNRFDKVVEDAIDENLDDCSHCTNRARRWSVATFNKVQSILPFSTFLS